MNYQIIHRHEMCKQRNAKTKVQSLNRRGRTSTDKILHGLKTAISRKTRKQRENIEMNIRIGKMVLLDLCPNNTGL